MESSKILVTTAILAILAIVLTVVVSDQMNLKTQKLTTTDTISIAPARLTGGNLNTTYNFYPLLSQAGWRIQASECSVTSLVVKNSSGAILSNNGCGSGGDYYYLADLTLNFCNVKSFNNSVSNTTTETYLYCSNEYIDSAYGRSVGNLIPGLIAVIVLLMIAASLYLLLSKKE